ncbi:spermatid-specific manchette-related protein 1 [Grus japonensis]|uniref:Spermatid-specific manchette-related protein 1 n=1 Tax=Grus japonensis TaxID=30415 RepID=A0ABC9XYQ5_GRUJA
MFLFSNKHKTPVSTYTDSYRPPCSIKKTYHEQDLQQLWKENKFVTQGLMMPPVQNLTSQGQPKQLIKTSEQECYRNTITAYWPEKYWLSRSKERDMVANMLHRLSCHSPPSLQPLYTMTGRGPFQGYYSPCSGRHYCLRGMDYYVDGASATRRHLYALRERAVRWDTSHFRKTGGVHRGSYIVHPEFVSEAYSAP